MNRYELIFLQRELCSLRFNIITDWNYSMTGLCYPRVHLLKPYSPIRFTSLFAFSYFTFSHIKLNRLIPSYEAFGENVKPICCSVLMSLSELSMTDVRIMTVKVFFVCLILWFLIGVRLVSLTTRQMIFKKQTQQRIWWTVRVHYNLALERFTVFCLPVLVHKVDRIFHYGLNSPSLFTICLSEFEPWILYLF